MREIPTRFRCAASRAAARLYSAFFEVTGRAFFGKTGRDRGPVAQMNSRTHCPSQCHACSRDSNRAADVGCHARRQDAPLVQLSGDSPHADEALGPQVIHDGPQVRRTVLCVHPDCCYGLLVAHLLARSGGPSSGALTTSVERSAVRSKPAVAVSLRDYRTTLCCLVTKEQISEAAFEGV